MSRVENKKRANMIVVGGLISLAALISAIIANAVCCSIKNGWCFMFIFSIIVPFFVLGIAICIISLIIRAVIRYNSRRNGASRKTEFKAKNWSFLSSLRVALAIILGALGVYILIAMISSPVSNHTPIIYGIIMVVLSALLFAIGFIKR